MPSWAKDNFKCQVAYTSGTNYIFKSVNLPNHNSFYYCGSHGANRCGNRQLGKQYCCSQRRQRYVAR